MTIFYTIQLFEKRGNSNLNICIEPMINVWYFYYSLNITP